MLHLKKSVLNDTRVRMTEQLLKVGIWMIYETVGLVQILAMNLKKPYVANPAITVAPTILQTAPSIFVSPC